MADLVRLFRNTREFLTPVLKESAFTEKGVLTPEEFVRAGDQLILKCPTWQWQQGEESKLRPYLPREKQYLIIRGCPSHKRVIDLNASSVQDRSIASEMGGSGSGAEDWCATDLLEPASGDDAVMIDASDFGEEGVITSMDGLKVSGDNTTTGTGIKPSPATTTTTVAAVVSRHDEYEDMEDDSLALDESTTAPGGLNGGSTASVSPPSSSSTKMVDPTTDMHAVLRSRRYDVSITYDNYYRTPRVWLFGYDENGTILKPEAIFDDIMTDYARKTVTIDPHPHLTRPHASIHPCQHGPAMLRIIEALHECGSTLVVDSYLFVFLKFIQSVIPTIEYDYTMDVKVRGP